MAVGLRIAQDSTAAEDVRSLVEANVRDNYAVSPADSVHVLGPEALLDAQIILWSARDLSTGEALAIGAIKFLSAEEAEVKSMRTAETARGRGIAGELLRTMMQECRQRGVLDLYLETGIEDFFAPARALYARVGFEETGPFADYIEDPNTVFLTRSLR